MVDCVPGNWSACSACPTDSACGGESRTQTREVERAAANGGRECRPLVKYSRTAAGHCPVRVGESCIWSLGPWTCALPEGRACGEGVATRAVSCKTGMETKCEAQTASRPASRRPCQGSPRVCDRDCEPERAWSAWHCPRSTKVCGALNTRRRALTVSAMGRGRACSAADLFEQETTPDVNAPRPYDRACRGS